MRKFWLGVGTTLIAAVVVVLGAARSGFVPLHANARPSRLEQYLAQMALDASVARQAPVLQNPYAVTEESLLKGLKVYRNNCAGCHGGPSKDPAVFGQSMFPPVPQFVIRPPTKPEWQLYWLIRNGVRRSAMAAWKPLLSEEEMWDAAAFLHRLDSLPPVVVVDWHRPS